MRYRQMLLLALAELFAMSLWFGVSAVAPSLAEQWRLDASSAAWLTLAVQLGFVAGTLLSATLNLPDIFQPRRLIAISALLGALANGALALFVDDFSTAVALRFLTGVCLAGVYPPGMKIIATWFREGRGFALGVLVGALTLGKGTPYLISAFAWRDWRLTVGIASVLAAVGALIVIVAVREGPLALPTQPFDITQVARVFHNRGVRLASFGYFGHMWELYAMWAWLPVMMREVARAGHASMALADAISFVVIGSGVAGCIAAGVLADRIGRAKVTIWAMAISGACCLVVGLFFERPIWLLAIALIWGASVVADSAQFSALVTEHGDARYLGTALTMQTCIGFLITTVSIRLMPWVVSLTGWRWAFIALAPGPILGIVAMRRLMRSAPGAD
jgi:MFS family permease